MRNIVEQIKISNKNYGKLSGVRIYITKQLKNKLLAIKSNRYGSLFLKIGSNLRYKNKYMFPIEYDDKKEYYNSRFVNRGEI